MKTLATALLFLPVRSLARLEYPAEVLYSAAGSPKTLLELRGGHNTSFLASERVYVQGLQAFLDGLDP
ncbi:MAG: hypothetical protein ACNA8G_10650 [Gammaproteobacteria bacterium]